MLINLPLTLSFAASFAALTEAAGGKAPKVKKNPAGVVALADFPMGNVLFAAKDGREVSVIVDMTGLPSTGGPFHYHIHENSVDADGCDSVGDDFNPYNAVTDVPCDGLKDNSYCEVGDLSGKHGWINSTCFETHYVDPYLSLNKKSRAYIIGRSISFHFSNGTKFACANIERITEDKLNELDAEFNYSDLPTGQISASFDEEAALQQEFFDYESEGRTKSELLTAFMPKSNDDKEDDSCDEDEKYKNVTNFTSSIAPSMSYSSIENENLSPFLNIGLGASIAGLLGFLF